MTSVGLKDSTMSLGAQQDTAASRGHKQDFPLLL